MMARYPKNHPRVVWRRIQGPVAVVVVAVLLALLLTGCNPPEQWRQTPFFGQPYASNGQHGVNFMVNPPNYPVQISKRCYDIHHQYITPQEFARRGFTWRYGDRCFEVGRSSMPEYLRGKPR